MADQGAGPRNDRASMRLLILGAAVTTLAGIVAITSNTAAFPRVLGGLILTCGCAMLIITVILWSKSRTRRKYCNNFHHDMNSTLHRAAEVVLAEGSEMHCGFPGIPRSPAGGLCASRCGERYG